jgi:hypothetical protein
LTAVVGSQRDPRTLRVASATVAAIIANVPWIARLVIACGEPPYPQALCTDRANPVIPWYVLVLIPPCAVLASAVVARRRASPGVFETTWILCILVGALAFVAPALLA